MTYGNPHWKVRSDETLLLGWLWGLKQEGATLRELTWPHGAMIKSQTGESRCSDLDECSPKTNAYSLIVVLLQVLKVSEWILDHGVCFWRRLGNSDSFFCSIFRHYTPSLLCAASLQAPKQLSQHLQAEASEIVNQNNPFPPVFDYPRDFNLSQWIMGSWLPQVIKTQIRLSFSKK